MDITPQTKVGALLEAHPELEGRLADFLPALANLKNPVLRKSVAQVATLEQAARMAEVPVPELLAFLRALLGVEPARPECREPAGGATSAEPPDWFDPSRVVLVVDAAAALASGVHPLHRVREALAACCAGGIVEVRSAFEPAPLLDTMKAEGMGVWCGRTGPDYRTCILKP